MLHLPAPAWPTWLEKLAPFERYRVELGARGPASALGLHVMEATVPATGGTAPAASEAEVPVLCLHGNPTWGFLYRRVVAELGRAADPSAAPTPPLRLYLPDLPGLGFSDRPGGRDAHTLERHIGWMAALLEALGHERLVVVVQDWGGPIGLGALDAVRPRAVGLVVLNTVVGPPRPGFRPTAFHRFARLPGVSDLAFRLLGFPQVALGLAQGDRRSIRGDVARAYRYPLRRLGDNAAPLALARMVPDGLAHPSVAPLVRCQSYVERFGGPAAIVWGDRDPVLGRVRSRIEKLLPGAPVTRTRAGHFLQEEVPDLIAAAIRGVARELAAR
ncbi:MAG: alpha/beta fold hydrolase [Polyangiaceae bacterium]|nr:alpha/beta fold hydrolase [Polyangiaceae bacterium]